MRRKVSALACRYSLSMHSPYYIWKATRLNSKELKRPVKISLHQRKILQQNLVFMNQRKIMCINSKIFWRSAKKRGTEPFSILISVAIRF